MSGWHGDTEHSGFNPDIASHEARFGSAVGCTCTTGKCEIHCECGSHISNHPEHVPNRHEFKPLGHTSSESLGEPAEITTPPDEEVPRRSNHAAPFYCVVCQEQHEPGQVLCNNVRRFVEGELK